MLQMAGALGNMPKFGPKKADSIIKAGDKGIEVHEDVADSLIEGMKKIGYKISKVGKDTQMVWNATSDGGLEVTYGAGEDARLTFVEE
jgi:hypothetical protein